MPFSKEPTMPIEPSIMASPHWDKMVESALLALFMTLLYGIARSMVRRRVKDADRRCRWQQSINYLGVLLTLVLIARIWVTAIHPLVSFVGILAAALTFIHKEVILSLTGGLFIARHELFSIGDRIQVGGHRGDILGTGPFFFTLFEVGDAASGHQSTGRILKIPNNLILTTPIVNHSKFFPHVWNELSIVLLANANWVKAKAILQQLTEKHTNVYEAPVRATIENAQKKAAIILHKTDPKVYVTLQHTAPAGIKLTSRFLCEARAIRETEVLIYEDLLIRFKKEADIELSFDMTPGTHKVAQQPGNE
jgi:small-conductance mechanosensitive channel